MKTVYNILYNISSVIFLIGVAFSYISLYYLFLTLISIFLSLLVYYQPIKKYTKIDTNDLVKIKKINIIKNIFILFSFILFLSFYLNKFDNNILFIVILFGILMLFNKKLYLDKINIFLFLSGCSFYYIPYKKIFIICDDNIQEHTKEDANKKCISIKDINIYKIALIN